MLVSAVTWHTCRTSKYEERKRMTTVIEDFNRKRTKAGSGGASVLPPTQGAEGDITSGR
jgi:hypothetical protein